MKFKCLAWFCAALLLSALPAYARADEKVSKEAIEKDVLGATNLPEACQIVGRRRGQLHALQPEDGQGA